METEKVQESGLTLSDILKMIKSHLIAVIVIIVAFFAIGTVYAKMQKPKYRSEGSVIAAYDSTKYNEGQTSISTEYTLSNYIIPTVLDVFTEERTLSLAVEKLNDTYEKGELLDGEVISVAALRSNLSMLHEDEKSLIIKVYYVANSSENAQKILSAIVDSVIEVLNTEKDNGEPMYKVLNDNIGVLSAANLGKQTGGASKYVIIFTLLGVVLAAAYVFVRELFNNKLKSVADVEAVIDIPVFAVVPEYDFSQDDRTRSKTEASK